MSEVMTTNFSASLKVSVDNPDPLFTPNDSLNFLVNQALANGNGVNQANRLFTAQITVNSGTWLNLNNMNLTASASSFSPFNGSKDAFGNGYSMSAIRLIIMQMLTNSAGEVVVISPNGNGNAWGGWFPAPGSSFQLSIGSTSVLFNPGTIDSSFPSSPEILAVNSSNFLAFFQEVGGIHDCIINLIIVGVQ